MLRYKITPPALEGGFRRERLLDVALRRRCTVLAAPAGHGKTCLAAQVAEATPGPTAWFAIDELDRDVASVVAQVLGAVSQGWPDLVGATQEVLDDDVALSLLATALETLAGPGCVVLDDVHQLPPSLADAVVDVVRQTLPPECRLVVCTRGAVPETLVKAEAAGTAVTFGPGDLVFIAAECAEARGGSSVEGQALFDRTGGWPLAVALSGGTDPSSGLRHAEVLAEIALAEVPASARHVLVALARLPRFPAALLGLLEEEPRRAVVRGHLVALASGPGPVGRPLPHGR